MGIFMNTRHSASESGHVTAELEALVNEATLGTGNYVFEAGNKFAITITPVTGKVNVSNGVFSWCGRLGGVDEFETVQYTPPGSETLYKKIVIGARYSKTPGSLVENIYLEAIESEIQSSESTAAGVTLTLDSDEIKPDTISAFLPLWEFTANSKTHSTPVKKFNTVNNLKFLLNKAGELSTQIAAERSARISADNTIGSSVIDEMNARINADAGFDNRLGVIEKKYELIASEVVNNRTYNFTSNKYRMFVLFVKISNTYDDVIKIFPAIPGSCTVTTHYPSKQTVGYKVETVYTTATITETSFKINNSGDVTNTFAGQALYGIT